MELRVAPALLAALPLRGAIITGDALYCQRKLCQQIVAGQGHYVVTVKGNQPQLLADIAEVFEHPPIHEVTGLPIPFAVAEQRDRHGDRHEMRRVWVSGALCGYLDWPGAQQVAKVERTSTRKGRTRTWTRYLITSLPEPDPYHGVVGTTAAELLALSRGHWSIENRLHYVRDVTLGEDASQVRTGRPLRRSRHSATSWSPCCGTPAGPTLPPVSATTPGSQAPPSTSSASPLHENRKTLTEPAKRLDSVSQSHYDDHGATLRPAPWEQGPEMAN